MCLCVLSIIANNYMLLHFYSREASLLQQLKHKKSWISLECFFSGV